MHVTAKMGLFTGLATALAISAMAQSALADPRYPPPAPVNWTGFYIGGDVGAVFTDAHFKQVLPPGLQETTVGNIDGRPTWGGYVGFNYELTPWAVLGLEGDFNWLSSANYRMLGIFDQLQQAKSVDALVVRGGLLVRPETLLYAKVGPAWLNVSGFQGLPPTSFQQTLNAIQAGVGIEAMVTPNILVRGEASYTYANQLSLNSGADVYRPSVLMLQAGLAYKFAPAGWGVPASGLGVLPSVPLPDVQLPFLPKRTAANPPSWTGLEAGGFASANANQVRYRDTLGGAGPDLGPFADFTVGGGWFVGGNLQIQRVVLGAEVSGNYENANFQTAAGSGGAVNFYHFANIDRVIAVTGRLGWLVTPSTLIYGKGGPAYMRMTPDGNYWNAIAPNAVGGTNFPGYEAGFGLESYVLPNLSVRLESVYIHSDRTIVLNGLVPNEFTLQPSIISTTLGLALHL